MFSKRPNIYIKIILTVFILLFSVKSYSQIKSINVTALVNLMQGSFSSEDQSKADSYYSDLRLHVKKIWQDRTDAQWLYGEYEAAKSPESPYRQRVYRVTTTYEGRFEITAYTLEDPLRFTGEWKNENPLTGISPNSLHKQDGCSVIVTLMNDGSYEGGTNEKDCLSDFHGAKYITSEVKLSADRLIVRERGFDEDEKQVWGPEKNGYVFLRMSE